MKKLLFAFIILFSLSAKAQMIKTFTTFGIGSVIGSKDYESSRYMQTLGFEFNDKFGIEYGLGYRISEDILTYQPNIEVASITHLASVYFKTERIEGTSFNLGSGVALQKTYSVNNTQAIIKNNYNPFFKVGLDHNFGKKLGGQINVNMGKFISVSLGLTTTILNHKNK